MGVSEFKSNILGLNMATKRPHSRKGEGTNVGVGSPWSLLDLGLVSSNLNFGQNYSTPKVQHP
jgi:hypothetical protein